MRTILHVASLCVVALLPACTSLMLWLGTGNGERNWIVVDGVTRDGATLTFSEVRIDGDGWLVVHPWGKGDVVVGATYVESGTSEDVEITIDPAPAPGDEIFVMLHRDANENGEFDFVFLGEATRKTAPESVPWGA